MKHMKRFVCMLLVLAMLCTVLPASAMAATANTPFRDVSANTWYTAGVEFAFRHGLMNGTSATTFAPNTALDRSMLVTILYRIEGEPSVSGTMPFRDVPSGTFYTKAVLWASSNGIVTGVGNNKFAPTVKITREQLATIFYRYSAYKGYDMTPAGDLDAFSDAAQISDWARSAVSWAVGSGLIMGTGEAMKPGDITSRAQVATVLQRYFSTIAADSSFESEYNDAMNAYAQFLANRANLRASGERFGLAYIDNNCIPELVISPGGSHLAQPEVFTFYKGQIVSLGRYGQYGILPYNPWMNCYGFYNSPYKIVNGTAVRTTGSINHSLNYGDMFDITQANIGKYILPFVFD